MAIAEWSIPYDKAKEYVEQAAQIVSELELDDELKVPAFNAAVAMLAVRAMPVPDAPALRMPSLAPSLPRA